LAMRILCFGAIVQKIIIRVAKAHRTCK